MGTVGIELCHEHPGNYIALLLVSPQRDEMMKVANSQTMTPCQSFKEHQPPEVEGLQRIFPG